MRFGIRSQVVAGFTALLIAGAISGCGPTKAEQEMAAKIEAAASRAEAAANKAEAAAKGAADAASRASAAADRAEAIANKSFRKR